MLKKIVIVSAEGCGPCNEIEPILKGKIDIIDCFEKPEEAQKLLDKVGSEVVPTAIETNGKIYKKCKIVIGGDEVRIECDGETKTFKK